MIEIIIGLVLLSLFGLISLSDDIYRIICNGSIWALRCVT